MHSKTALIVLDMQESFRQLPVWSQLSNPQIARNVNKLVEQARNEGHQVIWVLHSTPGSGTVFDPESGHVRLMAEMNPQPEEPTLVKTSKNAFSSTNLGQLLVSKGITRLVIVGIQTEQCCETTARLASDLGYQVTFVSDATATFPIVRPDTGDELGVAEVITRTECALAGRFARIAALDQAFIE